MTLEMHSVNTVH